MKAIVYRRYGSPDVLHVEEVEKPSPGNDEVLIKIRAAAVNPVDRMYRGFLRPITGWLKPKDKYIRIGRDLAGQVEAVGKNIKQFQPGDEVFGVSMQGSFAEYACSSEKKLALKPANITFEQAAGVPIAAITALQGLRDKGRIQAGQKVLLNGASGGVGTFAVQIAKAFGAEVTSVCGTAKVDTARSLGADHVIDYTREDFTQSGERYDLLLDSAASRSFASCKRVLKPGGIHVVCGGYLPRAIAAFAVARFKSNFVAFVASIEQPDLIVLKELMEAGKVTPVVDRCYALSEVPEAVRYLDEGHARGKIIITL